ncbi:hypothetical protein HD806DRAFT_530005 [Xylariaceae sp. AK1471]|nr:hypothetical protein HD806DRAFT_530005 [Xylariaceae sp. AK1471]
MKAMVSVVFGLGIILTDKLVKNHTYFIYDNYWNGNGEADANFDRPLKHVEGIIKGAPAAACDKKPSGEKVLSNTEGN